MVSFLSLLDTYPKITNIPINMNVVVKISDISKKIIHLTKREKYIWNYFTII